MSVSHEQLSNTEQMKWVYRDWVASRYVGREAIAFTLTMRQSIVIPDGRVMRRVFLSREIARQTARVLRNRVLRAVLGNQYRRKRRGLQIDFVVEGGTNYKRIHLHGMCEVPEGWSKSEVRKVVKRQWSELDWACPISKVTPLYDARRWTRYCLKEGLDALVL